MDTLNLTTLTGNSCEIFISENTASLSNISTKYTDNQKHIISIIDKKVEQLYGTLFPFEKIVIEASEEKKTMQTVEWIIDQLLEMKADRNIFLLGIGGGITTDITGFVASVYKRGVDFAFVPTTLLAMMDAAIGGKNGVNVQKFKNMIGAIRQPKFVFEATSLLKSIKKEELYKSLPELFKVLLIEGNEFDNAVDFFSKMEYEELFEDEKLSYFIRKAVEIKVGIVGRDEFERGERRLLNAGHTFAHALERCAGLSHGEAVGIGLVLAARNSGNEAVAERIASALRSCRLPVDIPAGISRTDLMNAIVQDKKITDGVLDLVVINGIGDVKIKRVAPDVIEL